MPSETRAERLHYNGVLEQHSKANLWESAISLLRSLPAKKIRPDKASFNIAIYACDGAQRWTSALLIFHLQSSNLVPSIVTYNSTLRAWTRDGWNRALRFMQLMEPPDLVSFNTSLRAASWNQALSVFDGMRNVGQVPDIVSQNSLLYSLQTDSKWQRALALCDTCKGSSLKTSSVTYGTILKLCKDFWFLALDSLQSMGWVNLQPNVVISSSIIASYETVALWRRAIELLVHPSVIGLTALHIASQKIAGANHAEHWGSHCNTQPGCPVGACDVLCAISIGILHERNQRVRELRKVAACKFSA